MAILKNGLVGLRHDPRLSKVPTLLSLLCILIGIAWILILPFNDYSRHTYVSENALLPGQVSTYFGGSEHNVFRAYRHEVSQLQEASKTDVAVKLEEIFASQGLKTARQKYHYHVGGHNISGDNVYAVLQGPRADATEALVLMAGWRNMDDVLNQSGVALVLTLARYLKRWSLWSKDILFVVTSDSIAGPQAWVDAYHSQHDPAHVEDLPIKGGALQGAIALDYTAGTGGHRYDKINLVYDGINGQLPNLDLFNTIVHIAKETMGIGCAVQGMLKHTDSYQDRLTTILHGMMTQGLGSASGPHSSFIPYHVDAVTLQTMGDGWHDEMSLGRLIESSFRSLNNLLEHLHQSFFFYILMEAQRFTSIGTYLPAAMLIAVNFSISAIMLWVQSGRRPTSESTALPMNDLKTDKEGMEVLEHEGEIALIPQVLAQTSERKLLLPLSVLGSAHLLGILPLYTFNNASESNALMAYFFTTVLCIFAPVLASSLIRTLVPADQLQQLVTLLSGFSLLILGVALATLSTLNFSLGIILGLLASPLSFSSVFAWPSAGSLDTRSMSKFWPLLWLYVLFLFSPHAIAAGMAYFAQQYLQHTSNSSAMWKDGLNFLAAQAGQAWHIGGTYTSVMVWLIWWPAWLVGITVGICALTRDSTVQYQQAEGTPQLVSDVKHRQLQK